MLTSSVDTYLNDIRFGRCQHWVSTLGVNTYLKEGAGWVTLTTAIITILTITKGRSCWPSQAPTRQSLTSATSFSLLLRSGAPAHSPGFWSCLGHHYHQERGWGGVHPVTASGNMACHSFCIFRWLPCCQPTSWQAGAASNNDEDEDEGGDEDWIGFLKILMIS